MRWLGGQQLRSVTYESNVLYALRFMIDCKVGQRSAAQHPAAAGRPKGSLAALPASSAGSPSACPPAGPSGPHPVQVVGGNWVELPAGKYSLVAPHQHQSHCQLEAHLHYSSLVSHEPQGQWAKMAPFRILSVDIECQGRKVGGWWWWCVCVGGVGVGGGARAKD